LALLVPATLPAQHADRWNLGDIYPSNEAWAEAKDKTRGRLAAIDACQSGVAASATRLRECLDLIYAIRKEVARVGSYASMLSDEDTRVNEPAQMRSEAQLLGSEFSKKTSFLAPAVIAAGREKIDGFLAVEPRL